MAPIVVYPNLQEEYTLTTQWFLAEKEAMLAWKQDGVERLLLNLNNTGQTSEKLFLNLIVFLLCCM